MAIRVVMPPIMTCKTCIWLTTKKGSMPKNRLCGYKANELEPFLLECNPDALACTSYESKNKRLTTQGTNDSAKKE